MILYSVIIPIYNVNKYLKKCFESLISMDASGSAELIFVDDGSTDGSGQLIDEFVAGASFEGELRVIHKENGGLSSARNCGLELARGEWILFVDSDDYVSRDYLSAIDAAIKASPEVDTVLFNARRVDAEGCLGEKLLYRIENDSFVIENSKQREEYLNETFLNYKDGWEAWNRCYRNSLIKENGLVFKDTKEIMAEDLLFNLEYMNHASVVSRLCNILYFYRINPDSLLMKVDEKTILPRFSKLCKYYYESIEDRLLRRRFYQLFYKIMNFQIQYHLFSLSDDEVISQLRKLRRESLLNRRTFRKISKYVKGDELYGRAFNWRDIK